jgi:hypothetical protein
VVCEINNVQAKTPGGSDNAHPRALNRTVPSLGIGAFGSFGIVVQQLFNQVHVRQEHSSATVSLQAQFIQGVTVVVVGGIK